MHGRVLASYHKTGICRFYTGQLTRYDASCTLIQFASVEVVVVVVFFVPPMPPHVLVDFAVFPPGHDRSVTDF